MIIPPHRDLIKSSKTIENKGFFVKCSPYPFIRFHTILPLLREIIRAKPRATDFAVVEKVIFLWYNENSKNNLPLFSVCETDCRSTGCYFQYRFCRMGAKIKLRQENLIWQKIQSGILLPHYEKRTV